MEHIRNIAIIAHVDHGKTTLVDCFLKQTGTFRENQAIAQEERIMDSMDLEREKGITIKAKNAAFEYREHHVNIVDTPGHADFGGEVERSLSMIDGVLLLVDAKEGPQAQTRFVLRKALEAGAQPIVVINKIDRDHARPDWVLDQVFELFIALGATDKQLDFPYIYASAKDGYATTDHTKLGGDMTPLFDMVLERVPAPSSDEGEGYRIAVANVSYSDYLGRIGFGKIRTGTIRVGDPLFGLRGEAEPVAGKVTALFHFEGLKQIQIEEAHAGDIVGVAGLPDILIGETLVDSLDRPALPFKPIDPPTIKMAFAVNDGPLAGLDGKKVTARSIWDRLEREGRANVSLQVAQTDNSKIFHVTGRGGMQIAVLVEQMRREGYEVLVSRPEVLKHQDENGKWLEPIEKVFLEVPKDAVGDVMEALATRKGNVTDMAPAGDRMTLEAFVPTRGLIGFEVELLNFTRGEGIMSHLFHEYAPDTGEIPARRTGALVSMEDGTVTAYALDTLQGRGRMLVVPGDRVYKGMIIGENARDNDLPVNPIRPKHLNNFRSQGDGKGIILNAPMTLSLERALEYIAPDEYVEATPSTLRLRKKILNEHDRKRSEKQRSMQLA
ncbi:MAG: translational GTPase TypA [Limisphaerales bacterium]|jgi:GTP-binding protein|nr:translational GTPase TypA [Verrucomicrobiota bacterium]